MNMGQEIERITDCSKQEVFLTYTIERCFLTYTMWNVNTETGEPYKIYKAMGFHNHHNPEY